MGDLIVPHSCEMCGGECDSTCPPHEGVYTGSGTVIINGRPAQKVGDLVSCSSVAIQRFS